MRAESGSKQRPAEYNLPRSILPEISGGGHSNSQIFCPPFAILGFSAVIFYGLRRYLDYDKISREPWGELYWQDLREVPRHASILFGIAIVLLFVGVTLPQSLCEQTALQGSSRASEADPNDRLAVGRNE